MSELRALLIPDASNKRTSLQALQGRFCAAARRRGIVPEVRQSAEFLYAFPGGDFLSPLPECDLVLFLARDAHLAAMLEQAGLRVFPSARAVSLCADRALLHFILQDFPTPRTVPYPSGLPDAALLRPTEDAVGYPMAVKARHTRQTLIARDREELLSALRVLPDGALLQEYLPESEAIRLCMAGGECVSASCPPTERETALARKACETLGLPFAEIALLRSTRGPLLCGVDPAAPFDTDAVGHALDAVLHGLE